MFNPFLAYRDKVLKYSATFNIVVIGAGGNAGPLIQKLARTIYADDKNQYSHNKSITLTIVDGDLVEEKNILRQPFIEEDIGENKAEVLGERYSDAYGIPIYTSASYISSAKDIETIFSSIPFTRTKNYTQHVNVLVGCVDNNKTRQYMHEFFESQENIIYIDAGVEGVESRGTESLEEGFSGQVVLGMRIAHKTILSPVGELYSNILEDKTSRSPLEACGQAILSHPQRMQTNETAALAIHSFLNNLIFDGIIVKHAVNFNAQTMAMRPMYITEEERDNFIKVTS